ncbi:MAG: BlaI/MecI/CopY family transcriptional regulator [Patescibacteria group bacterium]
MTDILHYVVDMVQQSMSKLEQEVMSIIWKCKSCSVRDVMTKLSNKKLAYTTVATILQRLYKKGIVLKKSWENSFVYSPKITKETYSKKFAQTFIKKFFSSFSDTAVVSFAESIDTLPKEKKLYLLKLLERKK